ncbi:MAG: TetR/AcrR family transcriptional regulator [Deltaproteobacteria bacterium]|nr:TetR/AcrR family transcriptional regulator [Deltaproteobacteria bacterium]
MSKVRTPKQHRGIQTKNRIMKAAFQLFAKKGIHGTNSKEIVGKAGVSIGSFYSYFKNKKTLLLEMLEDYLDRHYTTIWKPMDNFSIHELGRDDIKLIIESVFKAYDISPEFHRQTHALRYSDPDINRIYDRERNREVEQVKHLIENNITRLSVKDPLAAAIVIHNAVENVAHTAKFIGSKIDEKRLINELTDMIYSFFSKETTPL